MNTYTAKVGDRFTRPDVDPARVYEVVRVLPAGYAGTRESNGPRVILGIVGPEGVVIPGGLTYGVQHGSMLSPSLFEEFGES